MSSNTKMSSDEEELCRRPKRTRLSYAQMTQLEFDNPVPVSNAYVKLDEIGQPKPNGNKKTEVTGATAIIEEGRDDEVVLDQDAQSPGRCMFFKDGIRRIDYILAWTVDLEGKPEELAVSKEARSTFEENLRNEKLELEYDVREGEEVHFVKIHAPFDVLARYAEILKIRVPVKKTVVLENIQKKYARLETPMTAVSTRMWDTVTGMFKKVYAPFQLDENIFSKKERNFSLTYSKDKEYLFDNENKDKFFDNACRSRIVNFILRRKGFSSDKSQAFSFGVNKMIQEGHYSDAYPLHEGHWKATSANNARKRLFDYWAHWRNMFKVQPLDYIREYYGEKIAMYFTWLGFYTQMLIPASVVGLIVFIYGCIIAGNSYPVTEVCDKTKTFNMCPLCDFQCPYWNLSDTCDEVAASRIFDNGATVFFAIFMSLWGTLFLEFWKRKQAKFQYKWELTDFVKEEQPPRPEYLSRLEHVTTYKEDPVTGIREPHLPFWRKRVPIYLMSWTVMLFLACLAIIAVIGVIAYRVSTLAALQILTREKPAINSTLIASTTEVIYQNASMLTSITAACINLIIIIILNMIYKRLAFWLTDLECLRTQKEYDDSITLKLFALQFVNYYSSIFYIAFFKGRIVGRPGKYNTLFGARQEECGAGGCLIELCIQLAIIMTGKQLVVNNIMEIVIPKLIKWIKRKILKESKEKKMNKPPWEKDYLLESAQHTSLFYEYLEMVLQFGFLTIFVAAFPLGPLFALINNILEIRFDAIKFITQLRRPLAERIPDIGIWYSVLYGISRIAIMTNAFIISLTSDFIPRLVYEMSYSPDGTLAGYMNYTLSYFNTSDFHKDNAPYAPGVTVCRYRDFRKPPWDDDKYEYSEMYWHVLAARLAFVVVFENLIVITTGFISWLIPDVPAELKLHVRREAYITNEIIIKTELLRAQGEEIKDDTLRAIVENENKKFTVQEGNTEEGGALRYRSSAMGSMTLEKSPDHMV